MNSQKSALITGASSGIGKALAFALAKQNYVITLVSRDKKALENICTQLPSAGHKVITADLATAAGQLSVCKTIEDAHFDVLINNAGIGVFGDFVKTDYTKSERMLQLNVDAVMRLSHTYLQNALAGDALVNVASMVAFFGYPKSPVYAGTKGFVLNFTRSLWFDQKNRGIYVMALCPGITRTNWNTAAGGNPDQKYPLFLTRDPEQVANDCVQALKSRSKPVVICGLFNTLGYYAQRFIPTSILISAMGTMIGSANEK